MKFGMGWDAAITLTWHEHDEGFFWYLLSWSLFTEERMNQSDAKTQNKDRKKSSFTEKSIILPLPHGPIAATARQRRNRTCAE